MIDSLYFDNLAATKPFPEVLERFSRYSKEYWGPISSPHFLSQQQMYPLQKSLDSLFLELGAKDLDEVLFSDSKEEALRQIFLSTYLLLSRESGKTLFVTSKSQENSVFFIEQSLKELGCSFKHLSLNAKGQITRKTLEEAISPRTALVSISWADALTGVMHPLSDLAEVCREKGVLLHVDASHVFGKIFFRFQDLGVDFLTLNSSVMHGPKGTVATFVKGGKVPLLYKKIEESLPSIGAFALAIEMLQAKFEHYCMEIGRLRDRLEDSIVKECPGSIPLFKESDRLSTHAVIAFPSLSAESLLYLLNAKGVYASRGGGQFQLLSQLLTQLGLPFEIANSALSFSLSYDMEQKDIDRTVQIIANCVEQLRFSSKEVN